MEPTYEDYEKRAMPTGIILTQHSWDKLSPQGRVNLLAVLPTLEQRAELEQLTAEATLRSRAEQAEAQLVPGSPTERYPTVWAYEQACAALATTKAQLAAAEARATEAAAEAGKVAGLLVKAETEIASLRDRLAQEQRVTAQQEGQMLALVQETHRWSEAEKRDKVRHQEELDALKQELANWRKGMSPAVADMWGRIEARRIAKHAPAPSAAPAPVAPQQQQEGGGQ